ncbi:gypsy retrotransposon integrase-like protein, partial [Trifolium medium]|nr:gypsy retrotransposon integrase-like protein [Trifolium medium]
ARFGVPQSEVTDNGSQFINRKMRQLMEDFKIKQHFTSIEHPQTNGQAEAANRVKPRSGLPTALRPSYQWNSMNSVGERI